MINLFVSIYLLSFLVQRLRGAKMNVLSCGLFGFCGSEPPDMNKIKILGILNESRGTHSCGIFYNGTVTKGIGKEAIFTNFLAHNIVNSVKGANIFIGHTRWATRGEHTEENAHPFSINNGELVLAHNGTLNNAWQLCNEYKIDHAKIKVDSLALACLIHKEGEKVLDEYSGAAALLYFKSNNPNSLFAYHGASAKKPNGEEEEERPLYYMKTKTGFYFSSLGYALEAIAESDKEIVLPLPFNKVIKFTKGKQEKEAITVNRGDRNVEYPTKTIDVRTWNSYPNASDYNKPTRLLSFSETVAPNEEEKSSLIWRETYPLRSFDNVNDFIYWHKGRYWVIKNSDKSKEVKLAEGCIRIMKKSGFLREEGTPFYFYRGALLTGYVALEKLRAPEVQDKLRNMNFAAILSKYTRYPVTNLEDEGKGVPISAIRFCWFRNGRPEKSGFTPLFSDRTYTFKEGKLVKIICSNKAELPLLREEEIIAEVIESTVKIEKVDNKVVQGIVAFPTDEQKKDSLNSLQKELIFFNKKGWQTEESIREEYSPIGESALDSYIRDASWAQSEEQIQKTEVDRRIYSIFTDAVLNNTSILEELPNIGNFVDYLEDAIETQRNMSTIVKNMLMVRGSSNTNYEKSPSGIWVPKDENELPFDGEFAENMCVACKGFGLDLDAPQGRSKICEDCNGTGYVSSKTNKLFSDPELNGKKEDLLTDLQEVSIFEDNTAGELLEEFIETVRSFDSTIDSLDELGNSELAVEAADILKVEIGVVKKKLTELGGRFKLDKFTHQLNKKSLTLC